MSTTPATRHQAEQFVAAVEEALRTPTSYRDDSDVPRIGTAPPVAQPGVPPMSHRTTEMMRAVMFGSVATVPPGLIAIGVMVASEHANPTVIGMICAAPAAVAVPILAVARLLTRVRAVVEAAPAEHHHTYTGPVYQTTTNTQTKGVIAKTINKPADAS